MWSYYGAKTNIVDLYPKPQHDKLIEPFAGSARYALKYFEKDVLLVDKYEVIVKIWKWLQQCSPNDILKLPRRLMPGQTLNDFHFDCEEEKMLMGFLIKKAIERPAVKPTEWVTIQRPNFTNFSLQRIAKNLFKIKHWEIRLGSYEDIENEAATWFIDPPYQYGGHAYVMSNRKINFLELGEWCKERLGQVIVCETTKANWLDFKPMVKQFGSKGMQKEAIWTNTKSNYDIFQQTLFNDAA
jgi:site-specific DNA-adenine methylase